MARLCRCGDYLLQPSPQDLFLILAQWLLNGWKVQMTFQPLSNHQPDILFSSRENSNKTETLQEQQRHKKAAMQFPAGGFNIKEAKLLFGH